MLPAFYHGKREMAVTEIVITESKDFDKKKKEWINCSWIWKSIYQSTI